MKPSIYKKIADHVPPPPAPKGGPVVTISRDYGCPAATVAEALVGRLSSRTGNTWRWVSKEIVDKAADHFGIPVDELEEMTRQEKGFMDDFLEVLSLHYRPTEQTVKDTLAGIVNDIATQGNVVIVGRGSCVVTQGLPRALHVRIHASFDWRVAEVCRQRRCTKEEGEAFLKDFDGRHSGLHDYFQKTKSMGKMAYDLTLNCQTFSQDQMVALVEEALVLKEFI